MKLVIDQVGLWWDPYLVYHYFPIWEGVSGWLLTVTAVFCTLIVSLRMMLPLLIRKLDPEPTLIIQTNLICSDAHLSATTENK